ncbi:hypothetical protein ACMA5K_24345 [Bradyrhizobium diazoefficiens]|uniref:hypothetical protein n=1 Tax=Bradyrhizobium diazoefficiens TaxID=1355477 RepID=UPI000BE9A592|nr:hypothetical protein [Bradyrhizobium diazoefficiens]PDT58683.1 hypothetical protein CO678_25980 [Bradyrhizobium diazoefficiens]QLD43873.1 hypothetical protein HUW42_24130 [Bradyrhizobium diazoefficiens]
MITEAQLLADIALVSEIILEHGEKYAPLLDRLEQELEARRRDDPISRARRHLASAGLTQSRTAEDLPK